MRIAKKQKARSYALQEKREGEGATPFSSGLQLIAQPLQQRNARENEKDTKSMGDQPRTETPTHTEAQESESVRATVGERNLRR